MAMIGCKKPAFRGLDNGDTLFAFDFYGKECGSYDGQCHITYKIADDLYQVEFYDSDGVTMERILEPVSSHKDIFAEDLVTLFEEETGLFLHL